jgi:hypothetical protein
MTATYEPSFAFTPLTPEEQDWVPLDPQVMAETSNWARWLAGAMAGFPQNEGRWRKLVVPASVRPWSYQHEVTPVFDALFGENFEMCWINLGDDDPDMLVRRLHTSQTFSYDYLQDLGLAELKDVLETAGAEMPTRLSKHNMIKAILDCEVL